MTSKSIFILFAILGLVCFAAANQQKKDRVHHEKDLSDVPHHEDDPEQHDTKHDHEAFLGKEESDKYDELSDEESKKRLEALIKEKVDADKDGFVTRDEMQKWIKSSSQANLATDRNKQWSEMKMGDSDLLDLKKYLDHTYGSSDEADQDKEMKTRDERRWKTADTNGDEKLSKDEFLAFLHPEDFSHMQKIVVQETMDYVDKDKDGRVTEDEYISDMYTKEGDEPEPDWVATERTTFKNERDTDKNGVLEGDEISKWLLPHEEDNVEKETNHLLSEADLDKDGKLSLKEIMDKHDVFVGSQATDYGEFLKKRAEEL